MTDESPQHMASRAAAAPAMESSPPPYNAPAPSTGPWYATAPPYGFTPVQQNPQQPQHTNHQGWMGSATLVGVGGAVGWTAAAAYQWLNGGDFALLPAAKHATTEQSGDDNETSRKSAAPRSQQPLHHTHPRADDHNNNNESESGSVDPLTAQVQSLVQALQTQSQDQRDILTALLAKHKDGRHTDASMRRLRQSNSEATDAVPSMLVYAKLAEVVAELSSLRRDVARDAPAEQTRAWEERLDSTLSQVRACVATLQDKANGTTTALAAATRPSAVDATPVRTQIPWAGPTTLVDSAATSTSTTSTTTTIAQALSDLVLQNDATPLRVGAQLLYLYAVNLSLHSHIPRYRKIFTANESFGRSVQALSGGVALLRAVGFVEEAHALVWQPAGGGGDDDSESAALVILGQVAAALGVLKSSTVSSSPSSNFDNDDEKETSRRQDLLAQALACLSAGSAQSSLAPTTTTTTTPITTTTTETPHSPAPLPTWRTPDPSIVSPPATKKHGGSRDSPPNAVPFSPLCEAAVASDQGSSSSSNSDPTESSPDVLDVDSVWK